MHIESLNDQTRKLFRPAHLAPNDRIRISIDTEGLVFSVELYAKLNDIEVRASYAALNTMERIPERKSHEFNRWTVKATDISVLILNAIWGKENIEFTSKLAETKFNFLLLRFAQQSTRLVQKSAFKQDRTVPDFDYNDHKAYPLSDYQKVALATCSGVEGAALFMEQGTGKTPVVIARICHEASKRTNRLYRALILCPKNVRTNWESEFAKFATVAGQTTILRGGDLRRTKALIEAMVPCDSTVEWTAVIASYESVTRSWETMKHVCEEWDLVVLDESHYIKSPRTKRTQCMLELRDYAKARMVLTGTPIANSVKDLWAQLEFLGQGQSGFSVFEKFKSYYLKFVNRGGHNVCIGYDNLPILQERLARMSFSITKEEAQLGLPEKTYDIYEVEMTKEQKEAYIQLQNHLVLEIDAILERAEDNTITANNILTQLMKLAQITSGFVRTDKNEDDNVTTIDFRPNPKLTALTSILKSKGKADKTIIWATFVRDIERIKETLEAEGIKCVTYYGGMREQAREDAVYAFNNDPEVKVFIGNAAAGGVGLNLWGYNPDNDQGTNVTQVIYYSQNWSYTQRQQSEDRSHRRGTRKHVQYTDLVVPGTIDEEIRARVLTKKAVSMQIQDVRAIMKHVLETAPEVDD